MFKAYVYDYTSEPVTRTLFFSNRAPRTDITLSGPSLTLTENSPGSFEFVVSPKNVGYDKIKVFTSVIEVYKDNNVLWRGRVISEERDAYDNRKITCEGALNFLIDSIQLPMHVHGKISTWLNYLIERDYKDPEDPTPVDKQFHRCHNSMFPEGSYKRVRIAYIDPSVDLKTEEIDWYANYETTLDLLKNAIEAYDLKMRVSYENGITNLSFYTDYPEDLKSKQTIMFGKNLISYTRNWSFEDLATVIIPTGKKIEETKEEPKTNTETDNTTESTTTTEEKVVRPDYPYTPKDLDAVATIASEDNPLGVFYPYNDSTDPDEIAKRKEIIDRFGIIYKKVDWNDIEEAGNLRTLADDYFRKYQFDNLTIEVELFDLSLMMTGDDKRDHELQLLGTVRCYSKIHGLDRYFPITEVTYELNNPGNTKFTLGTEDKGSTISGSVTKSTNELNNNINKNKFQSSNLYAQVNTAYEYATKMMNDFANEGSVIFRRNPDKKESVSAIIIANDENWSAPTTKLWMWSMGGLAYSKDGGRTFSGIAITNDGVINANFIKTGQLSDLQDNTVWNLADGYLSSKSFTLETKGLVNVPSEDYLFLSNDIWVNKSSYKTESKTTLTVADIVGDDWKLVIGDHFGVRKNGTLCINEGRIGGIGIGGGYLRSQDSLMGHLDSFLLSSLNSSDALGEEGEYTIAGTKRNDWRLTIGGDFGVTQGGRIYSANGTFKTAVVNGTLNAVTVSMSNITYGGYNMQLGGRISDIGGSPVTYHILLTVTNVRLGNDGYVYSEVTVSNAEAQRLPRAVEVSFVLGRWDGVAYYSGDPYIHNINGSNFVVIRKSVVSGEGTANYFKKERFVSNTPSALTITLPANSLSATQEFRSYGGRAPGEGDSAFMSRYGCLMTLEHYNSSSKAVVGNHLLEATIGGITYYTCSVDTYNYSYSPSGSEQIAALSAGGIAPTSDATYLLGGVNRTWLRLFCKNSAINTSSRLKKKDITSIWENFDIFFDKLNPVTFRWKDDSDRNRHMGFILDEVGNALGEAGIGEDDFAGYYLFDKKDRYGDGGLMYSEFIALNTWQIQMAKKRISELEERIAELERDKNEN